MLPYSKPAVRTKPDKPARTSHSEFFLPWFILSCFQEARVAATIHFFKAPWWTTVLLIFASIGGVPAQQYDPSLFQEMRWRLIGPFRGGRTVAVTGIPGKQNVFYMAPNNGGVWKSNDYGRTWKPIFDDQPTGSIGALAVAPSNPDVIYAGSGEGLRRPDLSVRSEERR